MLRRVLKECPLLGCRPEYRTTEKLSKADIRAVSQPFGCDTNDGLVDHDKVTTRARKEGTMNPDIVKIDCACHCGTVRFHVQLTNRLHTARRCTCSYCRMRGAVAVSANLDGIEIVSGQDALTLYQFGTKAAKHYFCSRCGIYTHHQRRSNPNQYGINVSCLEGLSPFDFDEVPVSDGVHHPTDAAATGPRIDGVLRYERNAAS